MKSLLWLAVAVVLTILPAAAQTDLNSLEETRVIENAMTTLMAAPRVESAMVDRPPHRSKLADAFVLLSKAPKSGELFREVYRRSANNPAGKIYALAGMALVSGDGGRRLVMSKENVEFKNNNSVILRQGGDNDVTVSCDSLVDAIPSGLFYRVCINAPRNSTGGSGVADTMPATGTETPGVPAPMPGPISPPAPIEPTSPPSTMPSGRDLLGPGAGIR